MGAYFTISDAKSELFPRDNRFQVTSCGYMPGCNDLIDSSVSGFFGLLAKLGNNYNENADCKD